MRKVNEKIYQFGRFQLVGAERQLLREGAPVPLTLKAFDLLMALVQQPSRLVEKEDLMRTLWPDTIVEENNLTVTICALRKALNDHGPTHQYIQTVPRRGYRFVAQVLEQNESSSSSQLSPKFFQSRDEIASSDPGEPALFVGRTQELDQLDQLAEKANAGSGAIVFLTGEPGIGKTALAEEFIRRLQATKSQIIGSRGRCLEQYGSGEPYLPFLDAVSILLTGPHRERISSMLRAHAPMWCLQFPAVFASTEIKASLQRETLGATKERMIREMGDALTALAASHFILLLLEDLHWADPSTIDLINHLSHRVNQQRVLVLGTFRPEELALNRHPLHGCRRAMQTHNRCVEFALEPLSDAELQRYFEVRFQPNDFPPDLPTFIRGKTEGHPLFVNGLAGFLAERGAIVHVDGKWTFSRSLSETDIEIPESIRGMIRQKVELLPETDRRALQFASVQGVEFLSTVLAEALDMEELALEERLDRVYRIHGMIHPIGEAVLPGGTFGVQYRFTHVLYRRFLYDDLIPRRRLLLHRQAGEALVRHYGNRSPELAAQLAIHFECGRDFQRAIEFLIHAGDHAAQIPANAEAVEHYSRGIELAGRLPANSRTSQSLLVLHQKRGLARFALGHFQPSVDDLTHMLDHARSISDSKAEFAALISLAHVLFFAHRLDEMGSLARHALHTAVATANEAAQAEALACLARRQICLGQLDEAHVMLEQSIQMAIPLNHKPALIYGLTWRGLLRFFQSEYHSAEDSFTAALNLSSESRDSFMVLFCLYFLALTRANRGRISVALAGLAEVDAMARRNEEHYQLLKVPNSLAWIYREMGAIDRALEQDQVGIALAREHAVLEAEANATINLGLDYLSNQEIHKTADILRQAEGLLERDDWFRWRFGIRLQAARCEQALAQQDAPRAVKEGRLLLKTAGRYHARKYTSVAHRLLAQAARNQNDLALAKTHLDAAEEIIRKYPAPLEAWKVHAARARLSADHGRSRAARKAYAEASAIIKEIAAHVNDEDLRTTFLNSPPVRATLGQAIRTA